MFKPTESQLRVLHLAGSYVSEFYFNLSLLYAKEVVQPAGVTSVYVIVSPDGCWQLGASLNSLSTKMSLQEVLAKLPEVDLVVPHMFCFPGMTSFRSFFEDLLNIPVAGSPSHCTALATNKAHTRAVVAASGVQVAKAQHLRRGDQLTMNPPFVVKPTSEDNSLGVTLVWDESQIEAALDKGFDLDDNLLVEDYIPGREIRVGVIESGGKLKVPSMIEYLVTKEHPIRTLQDKCDLQADGTPGQQAEQPLATPICPAKVEPDLFETLANAAKTAHIALGCRDYSLYDFRIHAETNEPYLLEAGLFWTFGKISMISRMLQADGQDLEDTVLELWSAAAQRTRIARKSGFKYVKL
ncbi:MAG: D-alanine--D-alanine ligase [Cyanothece sp. SIO2G6]|nr:D-alanine--D-alanine ligase [Cyanothece sp. SIO2G6]